MLKTILVALLPLLLFFGNGSDRSFTGSTPTSPSGNTGTLEKMIVANGTVAMDLNMSRLGGTRTGKSSAGSFMFDAERDSFFKILVLNGELRGTLPSTMNLLPQGSVKLPGKLGESYESLVLESTTWGEAAELVVRDGRTGFSFFNVEGQVYAYDPTDASFSIGMGRLVLTKDYAVELGRPGDAGSVVGQLSFKGTMRPIEITQMVDGEVKSEEMPSLSPEAGTVPGPDVAVGDLSGLAQFGSQSGTQVGLAVGTDSCNFGTVPLNWWQNPDNDHPVIPQNLYRMSGGPNNDERFEQIGQSSVKHAFTALQNNICSLGCVANPNGTALGSGCSDPYGASLNAGPNLGSRAWINPFTGFFPRGDSATPNNSHTGHSHTGTSHRILTEVADLNTSLNPGATYYTEAQYITKHEYDWCQTHPGQCNMYNNVSYRRYNVTGTASPFSFSAVGSTVRQKAAINAWPNATFVGFEPAPGVDGIGVVAYKVTNPSPGVWHYEYAIYNQNLDRGIQSFSVPVGAGVALSNVGFHAPPQHPGWAADGTVGNTGYSSTPWTQTNLEGGVMWGAESFAQNPNANAIRWGTMYNIRFDSNRPPTAVNATIGFFKTGSPITVSVQGPAPAAVSNVTISGRAISQSGMGLGNVQIVLQDAGGNLRIALTNPFGFYAFDNVATGQTYTISPSSKRYSFPPGVQVTPTDNITNLDWQAQ